MEKLMHRRLLGLIVALVLLAPALASAQNTLFVNNNNVGIGTNAPLFDLHIQRTSPRLEVESSGGVAFRTMFELLNNGPPSFKFADKTGGLAASWLFRMGSAGNGYPFVLSNFGVAGNQFELRNTGDLTISGQLFTGGSCSVGCDRVFQPDYELESIEEHAESMWTNGYLPSVGATAEEGPYNLTQKTVRILNELEKAHIYIEQLHKRLAEVEAKLADE